MLSRRPGQNEREVALRKYFEPLPIKSDGTLAIVFMIGGGLFTAVALVLFVTGSSGGAAVMLLLTGLIAGLIGYTQWSSIESNYERALEEVSPQPTDEQVDQWFAEAREEFITHSRNVLKVQPEGDFAEPLILSAPTLNRQIHGIPPADVKWKKGQDGRLRFTIYQIIIIYLADRLIAFTCDLNFLRDVALNETIREYQYQDILSVVSFEYSESHHLPTGEKRTTAQIFRLSVASDSIEVRVDCNVLRQMTKEEEVPAMGAEKTVSAIRNAVREKKGLETRVGFMLGARRAADS